MCAGSGGGGGGGGQGEKNCIIYRKLVGHKARSGKGIPQNAEAVSFVTHGYHFRQLQSVCHLVDLMECIQKGSVRAVQL